MVSGASATNRSFATHTSLGAERAVRIAQREHVVSGPGRSRRSTKRARGIGLVGLIFTFAGMRIDKPGHARLTCEGFDVFDDSHGAGIVVFVADKTPDDRL